MPQVRTTFEPGKVITVDDLEYAALLRQGLIYTGAPPADPPPPPVPVGGTDAATLAALLAALPDDEGTINVRTTIHPTKLITVTVTEYYDLVLQGLVHSTESGGPISEVGYLTGSGRRDLDSHVYAEAPHPVYDEMPSLTLIFENRIV